MLRNELCRRSHVHACRLRLTLATTTLAFRLGVLLLLLRLKPQLTLAFGRLPAAELPETFRLLAVALVPRTRWKHTTTAIPMTSPGRKPVGASRGAGGNDKLTLSRGSWLLPLGPPEGLLISPSGILVPREAPPAVPFRRRFLQHTQPASGSPAQGCARNLLLVQTSGLVGARPDPRKREGNEEGDELDLFLPSKETRPAKETSEVDAELHPVNWHHPAYRLRLPFLYRSHGGPPRAIRRGPPSPRRWPPTMRTRPKPTARKAGSTKVTRWVADCRLARRPALLEPVP